MTTKLNLHRLVQSKVKFLAAEALRGVGGLLLDNEGDRFADELGRRDYVSQVSIPWWFLFKVLRTNACDNQRMWDQNKFPVRLILNGEATKEIEWHCKVSTNIICARMRGGSP